MPSLQELHYYAAKHGEGLKLTYDPHFRVAINTSASVVHIPTEVYDKGMVSIIWMICVLI